MKYRLKYGFYSVFSDSIGYHIQKRYKWWPFWITIDTVIGREKAEKLLEAIKRLE